MAVTFDSLISNPLSGSSTAMLRYNSLSTAMVFAINLSQYIFQAIFVTMIIYNLFQTVNKIIHSDEEEGVMKFRAGLTNAVLSCVALLLLLGSRYIYVVLYTLLGIPTNENPFVTLPY